MIYDGREYDGPDREIEQEATRRCTFIKNNIWGILGGITFAVLVAAGYLWWQGAHDVKRWLMPGVMAPLCKRSSRAILTRAWMSWQGWIQPQMVPCCHGLKLQSNSMPVIDVALTQWDAIIDDTSAASQYRELASSLRLALAQAERLETPLQPLRLSMARRSLLPQRRWNFRASSIGSKAILAQRSVASKRFSNCWPKSPMHPPVAALSPRATLQAISSS